MPGTNGYPIVAGALSLRNANLSMPALQILDYVMTDYRGTHPDFEANHSEFHDWLEPPSPFAELLREAFSPGLTQLDLQNMVGYTGNADEIHARWEAEVIDAFAARFDLWN